MIRKIERWKLNELSYSSQGAGRLHNLIMFSAFDVPVQDFLLTQIEMSDAFAAVECATIIVFSFDCLQIINLSSHAMPPMRLLSKDFIGSMLTTHQQTKAKPSEVLDESVETMEISDDENDFTRQDEKIIRRKAIEKESLEMQGQVAKKKEAVTNIESKIKGLKLDLVDDFEI